MEAALSVFRSIHIAGHDNKSCDCKTCEARGKIIPTGWRFKKLFDILSSNSDRYDRDEFIMVLFEITDWLNKSIESLPMHQTALVTWSWIDAALILVKARPDIVTPYAEYCRTLFMAPRYIGFYRNEHEATAMMSIHPGIKLVSVDKVPAGCFISGSIDKRQEAATQWMGMLTA
jgi:hypothetical protein